MKRTAFTTMEVIIAVVLLAILSSLAIPRLNRDLRQEAKDNLLSAIRYTQHLALIDDKTDPYSSTWQKRLWTIHFTVSTDTDNTFYTISSDRNQNNYVSKIETAIDPANGKYMYNSTGSFSHIGSDESPNIFIGKNYGINSMDFDGGCSSYQQIAFDRLGRPHNGIRNATNNYSTYMTTDCNITIGFVGSSTTPLILNIEKETGHVSGN